MIWVFVLIMLLVGIYFGANVHDDLVAWWQQRKVDRVETDLRMAQSEVDRAHRQARRDMNEAAGQSWRNLADGDRG